MTEPNLFSFEADRQQQPALATPHVTPWAGRKVRRLIDATLAVKGTWCLLCRQPGATTVTHDPPRPLLIARGVQPDSVEHLWPSHPICAHHRGLSPVGEELRRALLEIAQHPHPQTGVEHVRR